MGGGLGLSAREADVCLRFGVLADSNEPAVAWPVPPRLSRGTITLVSGPSGSGKSSLLAAIERTIPESRCVRQLPFPQDVSVVDAVAPGQSLMDALRALTACSLADPRLWLRRFDGLSEGEQFRARLARAISLRGRGPDGPVLCDEFGSSLHRRLARAIAFNLRKLASREGLTLVVATAAEDLERDLRPDVVIRLRGGARATVETPGAGAPTDDEASPTFAKDLVIEPGVMDDYRSLADLHYRRRQGIGAVDRVFVLRDRRTREVLGVVVYAYPPLELALRNAARLNCEVRILRRLIIHPDVRGCGLGRRLVAETLPMVGTPYVECLTAMGAVNPVFERAGMRRIGLCPGQPKYERMLRELRSGGADPLSAGFVSEVCRQPRIRRMVTQAVFDWYRAGAENAAERVARQSASMLAQTFRRLVGSQPVYYLWSRGAGAEAPTAEGDGGGRDGSDRSE